MGIYERPLLVNIFFDLDGTLIDAKTRVYSLFKDLVPASNLSYAAYWNLKRSGISHRQLLQNDFNYDEQQFKHFEEKWMSLIESSHYLLMDKPFEGVTRQLDLLTRSGFSLFIITARQKRLPVIQQIEDFGWTRFFKMLLVTEQKHSKADLVYPHIDSEKRNIMVGDTGIDIQCGKALKMYTVAVLSGFLSYEVLIRYEPDLVLNSVSDINATCICFNANCICLKNKLYEQ